MAEPCHLLAPRFPERDAAREDPASDPIDAVALLLVQHRQLEAHLALLVDEATPALRSARLRHAGDELAVHLSAEEQVFYPAVRAERTEDILLESLEEHLSLKRLLADLLPLNTEDPTFTAKCKVLREQVEHHHKEEEEHLFPKVLKLLSAERRQQLGTQMRQQQTRQQQEGEPREQAAAQTAAAESLDPPAAHSSATSATALASTTASAPAPGNLPTPDPMADPPAPEVGDPDPPEIGDPPAPDAGDPDPPGGSSPAGRRKPA